MKTENALKHFGGNKELTSILGLSSGAISQWGEFPPEFRQLQLEKLSRGALKAEPDVTPVKPSIGRKAKNIHTPISTNTLIV